MLTDAGPLIALIDEDDSNHAASLAALATFPPGPLVTTWPCFTEAMHLLGRIGGHRSQERLWLMRRGGRLQITEIAPQEADRMDEVMAKYRNVPMDLADASLVAVAVARRIRRLFTFDSDFSIYCLIDGTFLEVVR